ncbi:hypothetical protein Hz2V004 [Helicoverpa zea nudivirus 2]|uniref:Uncharacterized protein n=2 Tax=Betanudivirus hezeae TaxID=3052000 RepID=G9I030_HZNV2|nr:orf4 gene product [Helicoverpa zea nudivirus 2]AEW69553.1 hypothetical protein Hz2V004 [Helicoverpa zea nudivirus 2]WCZ68485.1 hypothetical protein HvNV004 [Heliothis virescens nudivirus]
MCPPSLYQLAILRVIKSAKLSSAKSLEQLPKPVVEDIKAVQTLPKGWRYATMMHNFCDSRDYIGSGFILVPSEYDQREMDRLVDYVGCPCIESGLASIRSGECMFAELRKAEVFHYLLHKLYQIGMNVRSNIRCLYTFDECTQLEYMYSVPRRTYFDLMDRWETPLKSSLVDYKVPEYVILGKLAFRFSGQLYTEMKPRHFVRNRLVKQPELVSYLEKCRKRHIKEHQEGTIKRIKVHHSVEVETYYGVGLNFDV